YSLQMPRMGESVSEATIVRWLKQPGDHVEEDESILEVATDKVDSDVPSSVSGILNEELFNENSIAQVGDIIATIDVENVDGDEDITRKPLTVEEIHGMDQLSTDTEETPKPLSAQNASSRFYSPLVKNIAAEEGIPADELDLIPGTGND